MMRRIGILAALLFLGCDGTSADRPAVPGPTPRSGHEPLPEPEPPESEPLSYQVVPRSGAFFFPDPCLDARAATAEEALSTCRRLARDGTFFQRSSCVCRRNRLVEVRPDDPVAFYRGCCWAPGSTPEEARAECERRRGEQWCEVQDPELVYVATGPYERRAPFREFEGPDHRYLVSSDVEHAGWVADNGEPPCFPAGTPIELAEGPRPIESVVVGDQVVAVRDGARALAPVLGVKIRRADRLLVLDLGFDSLRITPEHPVWLEEQWRPAREVQAGDVLLGLDGPVAVHAVRVETRDVEVRTLRVGPPHGFFAGRVWVHNY
jgi:hypothetical protein